MTSPDSQLSYPVRNYEYYFELSSFRVEDELFRVPRSQFIRHSEIFASMFTLPVDGTIKEGTDDDNAIKLEGVSSVEFQSLLKILYPLTAIPTIPELASDEWISVLKLATMWLFSAARDIAIQQLILSDIDSVRRICLGRHYEVPELIRSGSTQLLRRIAPISSSEAQAIGWETALEIYQLREAAVRSPGHNPYDDLELGGTSQEGASTSIGQDQSGVAAQTAGSFYGGGSAGTIFRMASAARLPSSRGRNRRSHNGS